MYELVEPALKKEEKLAKLAPRLDALKGKTIVLLNNRKAKAIYMLGAIEELLNNEGVQTVRVITDDRVIWNEPAERKAKIEASDAVILACGD
jgi:hypothetical protein